MNADRTVLGWKEGILLVGIGIESCGAVETAGQDTRVAIKRGCRGHTAMAEAGSPVGERYIGELHPITIGEIVNKGVL
jgi:hypothetical protein